MSKHQIFLSYSGRDDNATQNMIERVADYLSNHDVLCVRDVDAISPGDNWQASILSKIGNCSAILCFITPAYQQSHWCKNELAFALARRRPVIPILVKDAPLEPPLSMLHLLDLRGRTGNDPEFFKAQCERLQMAITTLSTQESPISTPESVDNLSANE